MIKKALVLGLLLQSIASAETVIPDAIKLPSEDTALLTLHATGDQVYQCVFKDKAYQWIVYPNGILTDEHGQNVGTHSKGPLWKYRDGSQIIGKIVQKTDEDRKKILPWLLIEVTEHQGPGVLSTVSYIHRVNTQGGLEPKQMCNANHLGTEKPVSYSADYIFYAH